MMLMSIATHDLVAYLPALVYLLVMNLAATGLGRVPFWVHPVLVVPGLVVRAFTVDQWSDVLIPAAAGVLLLVGGVFFLARVVSGATLFTVVGAFTLAPLWWGYPGVLAGLVVAGLYTGWRTARRFGNGHVGLMAWQTAFAFGVSPGGLRAPDPEAIPGKRPVGDLGVSGLEPDGTQTGVASPVSVQPFLLAGFVVVAALHLLLI